jgi:hypothetical protein
MFMNKNAILLLLALFVGRIAYADEGMWLPFLLKQLNEADMQAKGMRITAEDIYSVNKSSMKDAVVLFGRGCTGELISNEGLLITNHHCGYGQIQAHSSVQKDYLTDGFWAMNKSEELANPGLTVSFIIRIDDITGRINQAINGLQDQAAINKKIQEISEIAIAEATKGTHYKGYVRPFFYNTEYYLFITEVFEDVRLVGAPPSAIGKFGGDTDNWVWPRHTGDFSLFRIYAGADNKPAPYSKDNKPFKPRYHFPISMKGVQAGDFTMVYGFPGRTQSYLPSFALEMILEHSNPYKIRLRGDKLSILDKAMKSSPEVRIKYAAKQSDIANAWKKWKGESLGMRRTKAVERKQGIEEELMRWIASNPNAKNKYGNLINELKTAYTELSKWVLANEYQREAFLGPDAMIYAINFMRYAEAAESGKDVDKALADFKAQTAAHFKDYDPETEKAIFKLCMERFYEDIPSTLHPEIFSDWQVKFKGDIHKWTTSLYDKSFLATADKAIAFAERLAKKPKTKIDDPLYNVFLSFRKVYLEKIIPEYQKHSSKVDELVTKFFFLQREYFTEKKFYPDANLTLRVTYGNVKGYEPFDGAYYHWQTTLDGIMEKQRNEPENTDFVVPEKLKQLWQQKDYGPYAVNGTLPVAFIAANHTTGGNSGSPVLNADGHLIGTNFDRVWEGTMSDYNYDVALCRNISVDVRYMLFVIDKFAGAGYLLNEMTLIK